MLAVAFCLHFLVGGAVAVWSFPWPAPAAAPLAVPDKPSMVVLPFVNLSHDPQQAHVSDGITEELLTVLAKHAGLGVIAFPSAFPYQDKAVRIQQVGRELGVQYVLAGSVRTAADKVRITAQLIDATTGYYLWAERYERALSHSFALQDEITEQIVAALQVQLTKDKRVHGWPSHGGEPRDLCTLGNDLAPAAGRQPPAQSGMIVHMTAARGS